jgi:predicted ATPase
MVIANYQTFERICARAGSDLYRARRLTDGMPVLLKCPAENADAAQSDLLKREYLLLQSLDGAGIARSLALIDERGAFALVLEDVPGESLEDETVWRNLAGRPIESLIDLPLMSDPELQAAMRLLSTLFDAAYFTDSRLLCLQLCRIVNINLLHGTSGAAAHACSFHPRPGVSSVPRGLSFHQARMRAG